MVARSNGGFNDNMLDNSSNYEVEREVKYEWELVNEGIVEKE